jgi:hypothetical protein
VEADMAHTFVSEHEQVSSRLAGRNNPYRFGSVRAKHGRGLAALNRFSRYLQGIINQIAEAKVRRMRRELSLRGIYFDASNQSGVTEPSRQSVRQ